MPLEVSGSIPGRDRTMLSDRLRSGFDHPDIELLEGLGRECADDECLRDFARERAANYIVQVHVEADGRDYRVRFRVLPARAERPATMAEIDCPVCGSAEVADQIAAKTRNLRDWVLADSEPAQLSLGGTPEGAAVNIDNVRVGRLPYTGEVAPGDYEIVISAPDHQSRTLPLSAIAGSSMELEIDLEPIPVLSVEPPEPTDTEIVPAPAPAPSRWRLPLAASAVAAGVAGLVTGVAFLALDGRPIPSRCGPSNIDADGNCEFIYTSMPAGVALTVVGTALAGVGATLLVMDVKQRRTSKTAARVRVGTGLDRVMVRVDF